jgi:hypothetical protein
MPTIEMTQEDLGEPQAGTLPCLDAGLTPIRAHDPQPLPTLVAKRVSASYGG